MAAMRRRGDIIHTCAETIKKLFELCPAELVVQVTVNPTSSALVRVNFGVYVLCAKFRNVTSGNMYVRSIVLLLVSFVFMCTSLITTHQSNIAI